MKNIKIVSKEARTLPAKALSAFTPTAPVDPYQDKKDRIFQGLQPILGVLRSFL